MEAPDFWDDAKKSQDIMKELKNLKDTVEEYDELKREYEDVETLITMGYEENDPSLVPEVEEVLNLFQEHFESIRISTLCNPYLTCGCGRNRKL